MLLKEQSSISPWQISMSGKIMIFARFSSRKQLRLHENRLSSRIGPATA
jgi:hypothetical protein